MNHLTSRQLCDALPGVTYRQLDHACRLGLIPDDAHGSGTRRHFAPDTVTRLRIAAAVREASAAMFHDPVPWPTLCASVMDGPPPPERGYALLAGRQVRYTDDETLAAAFAALRAAVLVVAYDVTAPALVAV